MAVEAETGTGHLFEANCSIRLGWTSDASGEGEREGDALRDWLRMVALKGLRQSFCRMRARSTRRQNVPAIPCHLNRLADAGRLSVPGGAMALTRVRRLGGEGGARQIGREAESTPRAESTVPVPHLHPHLRASLTDHHHMVGAPAESFARSAEGQ